MFNIVGDPSDVITMFQEHRDHSGRILRMLAKLEPEYENGLFAALFEMETDWGIKMSRRVAEIPGSVTHILDGKVPALVGVIPRMKRGEASPFAGTTPLGMAIGQALDMPRKPREIPLIILSPYGGAIGCVAFRKL